MQIRTIQPTDYPQIDQLIRTAFTHSEYGYNNEAELVTAIRATESYHKELELVAVEEGEVIGHGLLSEAAIHSPQQTLTGLVLAPIEVAVAKQGKGIGRALMKELEERAINYGYPFISILGSPTYYASFGYLPASQFSITAPFDVPDEAFMIKALSTQSLADFPGTLRYSPAFD